MHVEGYALVAHFGVQAKEVIGDAERAGVVLLICKDFRGLFSFGP
ncbi:MAG: hypothetical protein WKF84_08435 [Pyrinomonadaceae bacterium]